MATTPANILELGLHFHGTRAASMSGVSGEGASPQQVVRHVGRSTDLDMKFNRNKVQP